MNGVKGKSVRKPDDLTGNVYNLLTAIRVADTGRHGAKWLCRCECGKETTAWAHKLKNGRKKSCGCLWYSSGRYAGENRKQSKLESVLKAMKARCRNPRNKDYRYYGAKGVDVCSEWDHKDAFEQWAYANGYQDGLTIDRIDSAGNYEPSNCRWVSLEENARRQVHNTKAKQRKTA